MFERLLRHLDAIAFATLVGVVVAGAIMLVSAGCGRLRPCSRQLGACGAHAVWWNECTRRVELRDQRGALLREIDDSAETAFSSADGAHVDAPKLTPAWRCKRRGERFFCHIYRGGASAFGAFVKQTEGDDTLDCDRWRTSRGLCNPLARPL